MQAKWFELYNYKKRWASLYHTTLLLNIRCRVSRIYEFSGVLRPELRDGRGVH